MKNIREELVKISNSPIKDSSYHISNAILKSYHEGNFLNQKQLAILSSVSEASITLFSKKIGFNGYRELVYFLKEEYLKYNKINPIKINSETLQEYHNKISEALTYIDIQEDKIIAFKTKIKEAKWIYMYSSYDQKKNSELFYEAIQSVKKEIVMPFQRKTDLKYVNEMQKGDLAIILLSGLDNAFLITVYNKIKNRGIDLVIVGTESQIRKIDKTDLIIQLPPKNEIDTFDTTKNIYLSYIFNYVLQLFIND
ncbi:hypothetical protein [Mesoplasma florum]|uniref:hypothetical protein n=1 Tax=Mesoplasma florum TaxID=2151 RepID=UPI000BE34296|nr:hypothetical protein [Mesoplasma florum]ATI73942.1 hypothetical protein CQZ70_01595 [Mesoplasma florum]